MSLSGFSASKSNEVVCVTQVSYKLTRFTIQNMSIINGLQIQWTPYCVMYCCTQAAFHLLSIESEPNGNIGRGVSVTKDTCFKEINEQMNATCMYNITYQE